MIRIKRVIKNYLPFTLLLLITGCASLPFFTNQAKSEISEGGKIPLKAAVLWQYGKGLNAYATFDKTPILLDKLIKESPENEYLKIIKKDLNKGYEIDWDFLWALKDGLPHLFNEVKFINVSPSMYDSGKLTLPKGTQLVIIVEDVKGRLTDFQDNGGNGSSEIEYKFVIKTPSGKTRYEYHGRGSDNFEKDIYKDLPMPIGFDFTYHMSYGMSLNRTIRSSIIDFAKVIKSDETMISYVNEAKAEMEMKASPSDLVTDVRFDDSRSIIPNNILDAVEEANLIVTIRNQGKGPGYGVKLIISTDNPSIEFSKMEDVGEIPPNGSREIVIPVRGKLDISGGKQSILIETMEKRGYDAKRVVMYVPTARLERPQLEIVSTEIADGDTGMAKGNGNGIPESGETIELTAFIKNQGEGKAIGVNLNGKDITTAIQWVRDSTLVGTISQGEIAKTKLAFSIPRNFDAKEISANLKVSDMRGVSNAEKRIALAYAKRSPDIQYAYRILSKGSEVKTITNGGEYEIELTVSNKGQISARGVMAAINPPIPPLTKGGGGGLNLSRGRIDLGDVKEQTTAPAQRINFSVPRTYADKSVPVNLEISQADFSSIKGSIEIPVDVKRPGLKYTANLLSKNRGNILEQGEGAILEVQILNEGNLSAEGVRLKIESKDENLKIIGQAEAIAGKIPASSRSEIIKFQVSTLRRIKVGDSSLNIAITQDDFSPVLSPYALRIMEEGAEIFDVASEDRKGTRVSGGKPAPVINLKTAQNIVQTSDETFRLAFEVIDNRNIETVRVEVNGVLIPLDEKAGLTLLPSMKKEIMKNIPLRDGENRIVITAYDSDNIPARKEFSVNRTPEEDVDTPPVTSLNNSDAVAVVIGISRYEDKDIPPVDYAKRDAETVREYLIKTLGFKEKNIAEFYDEKATATKLKSYFNTLKNRVVSGKSDVFVFYSGHGVPESGEAYFAPYDLVPYDIKTTGYAMKDLYKQMEDIKAKSITIVIDACFSGKSEGDTPVIKSASPIFFEVSNPLLKVKNSVVLTSSTGKQISSWYHKKRHGLFTYYFLKGLRSKADGDNDGRITVHELSAYVGKNVSEQARVLYNREQTPEVIGDKDAVVVRFK